MNPSYDSNLKMLDNKIDIESSILASNAFEDYFFENYVSNIDDIHEMISEFIFSYLLKINRLLTENHLLDIFDSKEFELYKQWFINEGAFSFAQIQKDFIQNNNSNENIKKVLLYYDFLLESAIEDGEADSILNWLYDIPSSLYTKFKSLGNISKERVSGKVG